MELHLTRRLLSCALATLVLAVQPLGVRAQPQARSIPLGEAYRLHSALLDEDRELQIALPETYSRTAIAYPVLFLLDGSYDLLSRGAVARAVAAFAASAAAFPDSPNAHDGLGHAYCRAGDQAAARESYGRALQIAERGTPPARLTYYRDKASAGCAPQVPSQAMPDGRQWMTENLKVSVDGSYCYADAEANCERYGRLYTWSAAQRACSAVGQGWRLPSNEEWQRLAKAFGGVRDDSTDGGAAAFVALQAGGSSGFDAQLGGGRTPHGQYTRLDAHGFYWTATETGADQAWLYNIGTGARILNRHADGEKSRALAVRCIRD